MSLYIRLVRNLSLTHPSTIMNLWKLLSSLVLVAFANSTTAHPMASSVEELGETQNVIRHGISPAEHSANWNEDGEAS